MRRRWRWRPPEGMDVRLRMKWKLLQGATLQLSCRISSWEDDDEIATSREHLHLDRSVTDWRKTSRWNGSYCGFLNGKNPLAKLSGNTQRKKKPPRRRSGLRPRKPRTEKVVRLAGAFAAITSKVTKVQLCYEYLEREWERDIIQCCETFYPLIMDHS